MLGVSILFFLLLMRIKKVHLLILVSGIGILIGMSWSGQHVYNIIQKERKIAEFDGKKVDIIGKIHSLYKKSQNSASYILEVQEIDHIPLHDIRGLVYYPKNLSLSK